MPAHGTTRAVLFVLIAITTPGAAADDPAGAPASRPAVPLVYGNFGLPQPLGAAQITLILRSADQLKPEGRDVWFIGVRQNGAGECWAMVFYKPERTSPGLRRGRYADVRLAQESSRDAATGIPHKKDALRYAEVRPYVQVARAFRPFNPDLQTPAPADLPFEAPRPRGRQPGLSDAELVQLVNFARSVFKPRDDDDPICTVRTGGLSDQDANAPDRFVVCQGAEHWGGRYLELERRNTTFKVTHSGNWSGSLLGD